MTKRRMNTGAASAGRQRDADRVLDLLVDLVADRVRARIATPDRRLMRISDVGITTRQIAALQRDGVTFAKVGKYWMVDGATFDAYLARQQQQQSKPANESNPDDAIAGVDPSIAAAFRRAAGGGRGRR